MQLHCYGFLWESCYIVYMLPIQLGNTFSEAKCSCTPTRFLGNLANCRCTPTRQLQLSFDLNSKLNSNRNLQLNLEESPQVQFAVLVSGLRH